MVGRLEDDASTAGSVASAGPISRVLAQPAQPRGRCGRPPAVILALQEPAEYQPPDLFVVLAPVVFSIALFAFYEVNGKPAALALWGLFGTTNQLLAALTLSLATLYLKRRGAPIWYTGIPALFMMGSTIISMSLNLWRFAQGAGDLLLLSVGSALLLLGLWVMVSLALALRRPAIGWRPEILGLEEEPET